MALFQNKNALTFIINLDGLAAPIMTEAEEEQLAIEFRYMDQDGDGNLDWWEFLNHESKACLMKKNKVYNYIRAKSRNIL